MAFVQTVGAAMPEFDLMGDDAESGPMWRARDVSPFKLALELGEAAFEVVWVSHGLALERGPGAKLAAAGTNGEVGVGFSIGDALDSAFDADLDFQRWPVEAEGGFGSGEKLLPLTAVEVGVEDKAALVERLEEQDSVGGLAIFPHGRH